MSNIEMLSKEFVGKYESFILGCDSVEEMGLWDKEQYGEMDVFYENELITVILRLITADGKISDKEAEYINRNFGFEYDAAALTEVYDNCREELRESFEEQFKFGYFILKSVSDKLAEAYKELLALICDIIIAGDGEITGEEAKEAKLLKSLI